MSAKEMFEKLGYEHYEDENFVDYQEVNDKSVRYHISFCKFEKCIELMPKIDGKTHYFTRLDRKLLQAINKQIEELGWEVK